MPSISQFPSTRRRQLVSSPRRGFALLITITLLAFLVLLLVSLASLTRVETQVAGNNQQLVQARQNALMALNIALGQLQKFSGPDQRVTAPANFANGAPAAQISDAKKGLVAPVDGARHWLGVWGNSSVANDIYGATPQPVLLNWLVSGNEKTVAPASAADGHFTATTAVSPDYKPNLAVTNLSLTSTATDSTLRINGKPAALLVGPRTAGTTSGALSRYIAAPLVVLESTAVPGMGTTSTTVGRYAFWIGDEGVKAQYNLRDSLTANDAKTSADARYRFRTSGRDAIEMLPGFTTYPINSTALDRISSKDQFQLADTSLALLSQQQSVHDLTSTSWGVLANSQTGGLRTDLSHVLQQSTLGANFANKTVIPAITPSSQSQAVSPTFGAKWETLKSFADLTTTAWQSTPVNVRPATATTAGISPTIVQNRLMFSIDCTPKLYAPSGTTAVAASRRFYIHVQASFTISNPYSFPIRSDGVDFSYAITTPTQSEWGLNLQRRDTNSTSVTTPPFDRNKFGAVDTYGGSISYFPFLVNKITYGNDGARSVFGNLIFRTPAFTLNPGEVKTYSLANLKNSAANSTGDVLTLAEGSSVGKYYNYDTGIDIPPHVPAAGVRWGYFLRMVPGQAMTLQMAVMGSPAADGLLPQPQTGVLQSIVNADLSAANAPKITTNAPSAPYPWSYSVIYPYNETPLSFGGYGMSLALPMPDEVFYDDTFKTSMGSHRAYADYNLTAQSFALPPVSSLLTAANAATNLETVPPYTRKYIRGPDTQKPISEGQTFDDSKFSEGALNPRWGFTTRTTGVKTAILYDVPQRANAEEVPFFSIGQLQHADLTGDDNYLSVSYQPRYAVGNSRFNIYVQRDQSVQSRARLSPQPNGVAASGNVRMFDLAYLLNTSLWDNYFFSSLIQSGTKAGTPANQRMAFASYLPTPAQLGIGAGDSLVTDLSLNSTQLLPEKAAARYMMIKGAFNINSTSVDAWKAVIAGTRSLPLLTDTTGTPFPRSLNQTFAAVNADAGQNDNTYSGYRRLTDAQVTTLATKIVEQVRKRGPFLSLGHFVNRQLGANSDDNTASGALQAAIDDASLNPFTDAPEIAAASATSAYAANGVANLGNRSTGVPGWLTQADILQSVGSVISARSDTFTIRVYGDVVSPLDSSVIVSRAWCEATVQRFADYVDPTISAAADPTSTANKTFGRKYRVTSFRWLNASDI